MFTYIYKKAWEFSPSLVPHLEALALPGTVERATRKPTPDMNVASIRRHTSVHRQKGRAHNTSRRAPTVAMFLTDCCHVLDCTRNLRDFQVSSTKRSKRLCHICVVPSLPPSGLPLRGQRHKDNKSLVCGKINYIEAVKFIQYSAKQNMLDVHTLITGY